MASTWGTSWGTSWAASWDLAFVTVPDVVGQLQADGTATLEGDGFVVAVVTAYSSVVPAGTIISQDPIGGVSAGSGSTVTITVSLGDAPAQDTQASGGWWPDYEHHARQRRKRREELEALEAEAQQIADATTREIYRLEREQEAKDADAADMARLQALADKYATSAPKDLPKHARVAILNAQDARTRNALEQMQRVIEQVIEDELIAVNQIVMLMLDE